MVFMLRSVQPTWFKSLVFTTGTQKFRSIYGWLNTIHIMQIRWILSSWANHHDLSQFEPCLAILAVKNNWCIRLRLTTGTLCLYKTCLIVETVKNLCNQHQRAEDDLKIDGVGSNVIEIWENFEHFMDFTELTEWYLEIFTFKAFLSELCFSAKDTVCKNKLVMGSATASSTIFISDHSLSDRNSCRYLSISIRLTVFNNCTLVTTINLEKPLHELRIPSQNNLPLTILANMIFLNN